MSAWRPALRIARRGVRRHLGRSLLIAILVGVPVAGATLADVLARTLSADERKAQSAMGPADAVVRVTPFSRLTKASDQPGDYQPAGAEPDRDPAAVDLAALLPRGARVVPEPARRDLLLARGERIVRTMLMTADAQEPLHRHQVRLVGGRAATAPDEVLVTPRLAERLGLLDPDGALRDGAAVRQQGGPAADVSGIGLAPFCLDCEQLFAAPGSALERATAPERDKTAEAPYLVDLPPAASARALEPSLAAAGVSVVPRDFYLHPELLGEDTGSSVVSAEALRAAGLVAVIAGIGLLEVVLLAGTAFAVGARRQTRELGLVAAAGGTARDVRRIVLAQGLVLGALGAALGIAAGFAIAIAGRPLWENLDDGEITAWAFGPWEIGGAALVGLLSGLAAAVVPAIGAGRMRPVDALSGRFRQGRAARRRAPLAGAALVAAGAACGLAGDRLLADDFAAYARTLADVERTGQFVTAPSPTGPLALILGGATLAIAGLVLVAPALIGWLSAAGARLPVSARLAVRDAARHRHRTGPATSAIAVAVAGSVVLALLLAGQFRADELRYIRSLPPGVLAVESPGTDLDATDRAAELAAAVLPGSRVHRLEVPLRELYPGETLPPDVQVTDARGVWAHERTEACAAHGDLGLHTEPGCEVFSAGAGPLGVAGDPARDALVAGGALDAAARAALAGGKVVVFVEQLLAEDGTVVVDASWDARAERPRTVRLPAHLAERPVAYTNLPSGLVPRQVVRELGWDVAPGRALVSYAQDASADDVDTALAAAEGTGAFAYVEEGPGAPGNAILLIVAGIAAFITLVGVAISVALSAAEGRADLATLAAVGAAPSRRRALAGSQALLISGVGCALGVALGTYVAFTARSTTGSPDFVIPWANLTVTGIAVPLLAVLVATLFTPSRLPLVRRAD